MTDQTDGALPPESAEPEKPQRPREPAFNLPSGLVAILTVLIAIHVVRTYFLSVAVDNELVFNFAFLPARYDHALSDQSLAWLWSPITYSFLHGSWEHLIFNGFWMIAFGAPVIRRIGMVRLAVFWCLSAIAAVALHTVFHWGAMIVVVGASGVVAGLMGARRAGASRQALIGAAIGTVAGLFTGLVGVLFMPLVGATAGEYLARRDEQRAVHVGIATWLGILLGMVAKVGIAFVMVGIFAAALVL